MGEDERLSAACKLFRISCELNRQHILYHITTQTRSIKWIPLIKRDLEYFSLLLRGLKLFAGPFSSFGL